MLARRKVSWVLFIASETDADASFIGIFNSVTNSVHIGYGLNVLFICSTLTNRSGNAFALFLKSQRKWENPALQDDHRDQFRQLCAEHKYDGTK